MIDLNQLVEQAHSLPPLPDTAVRLMSVISDPCSTVDEIVDVIRYDQAITGEVLRLCNSAYYGLSRRITSLQEAMIYLGNFKVLQLVMSVHTNSMLAQPQSGYGLEPGVLWRHSVAVAIAASLVAQRLKLPNVNLLFTAGLLHDIGKVVLNSYVGEAFAEIVRRVTEEGLSFVEAEHETLGCSHEEIGAAVVEKWKLPHALVRCVRYHHDPGALGDADALVDGTYLADSICLLLGIGLGVDGLCYRADPAVVRRHGLYERDLEDIGVQTLMELKRVEQLFANGATPARERQLARKQETSNVTERTYRR